MSNVIKANPLYSGADQPAVIGKVYEQLFDDSSGNTTVRYLRCFKANGAVAAGDVIGVAAADVALLYQTGKAAKSPGAGMEIGKVYGVALAAVADGEYGFCVSRGLVESVSANSGVSVGDLLATHSTAGMVTNLSIGAGKSSQILGYAMTATSSATVTAYIDLL
jgi:hypothetical protein